MRLLPLLACAALLPAAVIEDFERGGAGVVERDGGGHALALEWGDRHGRWVELALPQGPAVPLEPGRPAALRLAVRLPPGIASVSVRLLDARHEVLQWAAAVPAGVADGTWRHLLVPIDLDRPQGHWAGNNDGRADLPLRLGGFSAVFADPALPAGRLLIDEVELATLPAVSLATDRFPFLVDPGPDGRCELVVANPEERALELDLSGRLGDFAGATTPLATRLVLPPRGEVRWAVPLADRRPGIRWLDWALALPDGPLSGRCAFVLGAPLERRADEAFRFAICSHTERQPAAEWEPEMQALAAAGATVVRVSESWNRLEPRPGEWRWDGQDRLVELAARHGLETQAILCYGNEHAAAPALRAEQAAAYRARQGDAWKITLFSPPEEAPWRAYVAAMATRYRGRIRLYEMWNEPDLGFWRGTTDQYLGLLRTAAEEIRRADPAALVMTGGFATVLEHAGRARNPDLQQRVLAEAGAAFDLHALHQHGGFDEFRRAIAGELARLRAALPGPRPLWFNETAISSSGIGEQAQAATLVKKLAWAKATGAVGYTWYDLRNDGWDAHDGEHNFGLLRRDFQPKAAFAAWREAVRRLQGLRPAGVLAERPGLVAPRFAGADGQLAVWWNEGAEAVVEPLPLRCGAAGARQADLMGAVQDLPAVDGWVVVQPGDQPQYLLLPAAGVEVGEALVRLGAGEAGAPVEVALANPLARPLGIALSWQGPAGDATATVALAPGGRAQQRIELPPLPATAREQTQAVRWQAVGLPWRGSVRRTLAVVHRLAATPPDGRAPDWVLDRGEAVVDLCRNDPTRAGKGWRGADDLSARVWAWQADEALRLRIEVRDDRHRPAATAADAWRGDGVQVGLQLPGQKGYWELGAALAGDGSVLRSCWSRP
ncbi:MAG: beta-galactosidase, partial [Planctomycetes bacterium]|nr:beta-galactosidase [Planctomycetota bacterium]